MLWLKAFHLIFIVTWFAAMFYLPRLFVYHAMSSDQVSIERFKIMERKLFWGIMTPSAVLTIFFGSWMMWLYGWDSILQMYWLHLKLCLVTLLLIYHIWCGRLMMAFKKDQNHHSHRWYRWFNEAPVLLLIVVILLAVLKPSL